MFIKMHTFNFVKYPKCKSTIHICFFILSISEKTYVICAWNQRQVQRYNMVLTFRSLLIYFFQEMDFSYKKMERERFWRENYRRVESQLGNSRAVSLWNTPCVSFHKSTKIFLKQNTGCLTKPFEFWVKFFDLNTL